MRQLVLSLFTLSFVAVCGLGVTIPLHVHAAELGSEPAPLFKDVDVEPPAIKIPTLLKPGSRFLDSGKNLLTTVINYIISQLSLIAGLIAFGMVLWGGLLYLTAGGNAGQVQQAKSLIIGAVVGILIVSLSYVLLQFIVEEIRKIFS